MQPQTDPNYLAWLASQQAAPQAPPAPQYAPPQYPAQPAPQYAQPQYAPQPQAPAGADGFSAPPPVVNVVRPKVQDMAGRLVLATPRKVERNVPNTLNPGQTQDRMTVDFVVLDGGTLYYGGNPNEGKPHTHAANTPHETLGLYVSQALLVAQFERALPQGNNPATTLLGRVVKGQSSQAGRQAPWKLADPTPEDMRVARNYIAAKAGATIQPAPQVAQPMPQAQPAPQYAPQPATMAAAGPALAYMASPDPAAQYAPAPAQQAGAPTQPMPPQPMAQAPAGMDPAYWVTLTPEAQAGILAANAQTPWGPPAPAAAPPQYAQPQYAPQPTH